MGCHGEVIKAYNTHVIRNADSPVVTFCDGGDGTYIMGKQNGSYPFVHQFWDIFSGGIVYEIAQTDIVFIDFQAVLFHGVDIGMVSGLLDIRFQRAGDQAYFFMAQTGEMFYSQFKSFLAVAAYRGYVGIPLDIIVI